MGNKIGIETEKNFDLALFLLYFQGLWLTDSVTTSARF